MFDDPPPMPQQNAPQDMSGMLNLIRQESDMFERALAGYVTMSTLHAQALNGVQEGERRKGLPILSYSGTADGVNAIDVRLDLKQVPPNWLPDVLAPFSHVHALAMLESMRRIAMTSQAILQEIEAALPQPVVSIAQPVSQSPAMQVPSMQRTNS